MERRSLLVACGLLAGTAAPGCTSLLDGRELAAPTGRQDGDDVRLVHERDGEAALVVTFQERPSGRAVRRLRPVVEQPSGTRLESATFRFDPGDAAEAFVRPPSGRQYAVADEDGTTVVELPDGDGGATTGFDVLVAGAEEPAPPVGVTYDITLSADGFLGTSVEARGGATLEPADS